MHLSDGSPAWQVLATTPEVLHRGYTYIMVYNHHNGKFTCWKVPDGTVRNRLVKRAYRRYDATLPTLHPV